jgi:predicted aspartyl protease
MKVYSFDYDVTYEPPAPVFEIIIRKTGQKSTQVELSALVDSGADATMVPIDALHKVGARYVETRQMRGVTGVTYPVDLYSLIVQIGSQTIPPIRAIAATSEGDTIVGRDILNQLVVTLNGPANVTEVLSHDEVLPTT